MPPTSTTRASITLDAARPASLYLFSRFRNCDCNIRDTNTPRVDPTINTLLPCPFFDGFPPASLLKTFRTEGS